MKAAITGATGFVGGALARALLRQGFALRALCRPDSDRDHLRGLKVEWVTGDLEDPGSLNDAFAGCETLFHVAGIFSYWVTEKLIERTLATTRNALEAASDQGIKKVILTSSSVTVGATPTGRVLHEGDHAPQPDDPLYIRAKREQENLAFSMARQAGIDLRAVSPGLVIGGPDARLSEGNRMIVSYLKDPWKSTWIGGCNLVHVDNVARAHLLVAEKGQPGQRYLCGAGNLEWRDVHALISELAGLPGPFLTARHTSAYLAALYQEFQARLRNERPATTREQARMVGNYYWYDSAKLEALGFRPMPVREAMVSALAWLLYSPWIPDAVRSEMKLSREVRDYKAKQGYAF